MRKVLISGGSRGIGAECVRYFSSLGDSVTFLYKSSASAAKELAAETGAEAVRCDISNPVGVKAAVESAGDIDVLVCNAGVAKIAQICDTADEDWDMICGTNLSGAFYLCREVSKIMVRRHSGRIITVGSVWGKCGASCEVAYSAAKAGIRGLTLSLAKELAPSGITVNCVEPGVIDTDMNACLSDAEKAALTEEIPLGRMGKPHDVAKLIGFLASDEAGYMTAQLIGINGGFGE